MRLLLSSLLFSLLVFVSLAVAADDSGGRKDINLATAKDLTTIHGVGKKTAAKILEYRDKNGPFTSLHQLKKVKGIGVKTVEKFACVFYVPEEGVLPCRKTAVAGKSGKGGKVNINTASAKDLTRLFGIGPKRAKTIIVDREQNGWFTSVADLQRIKGFGKKTVERLRPQVETMVDINTATAEDFKALGFTNVEEIFKYRNMFGGFKTVEDLESVPGTNEDVFDKAEDILIIRAKPASSS